MSVNLQEWCFPFAAMGGPCELRLYAKSETDAKRVFQLAKGEVERLEAAYSRYRDDSVVSKINASAGHAPIEVDDETAALLDYANTAYDQSGGLFDITSGILRSVWDFKSGCLPEQAAIQNLMPRIGWPKVEWQSPRVRLPFAGMQLDFGGYVKEYTVDAVARLCRAESIEHGLVDLAGDIHVIGPHPDGSAWQVGIRDPRSPEEAMCRLSVLSGGVASSGDYERYMEVDGKRYCHILNPATGWPCEGLAAVTVAAPLCLLAGTASTIAMLKGRVLGTAWLEELGLPYLWVTAEGEMGGDLFSANC